MSGRAPCGHARDERCGCCAGVGSRTPALVSNRAGLPAIQARVGTYGQFRETMLVRLSASTHVALEGLGTRDPDDFSIALLDSWATVADVLTFYQERMAQEDYLRTATERRSVRELSAAIGYELGRGVAAGTALAFTVDEALEAPETTIPVGTQVQSVPGPGEQPQTFEATAEIKARPAWNALRPRLTRPRALSAGVTSAYFEGVITDLKAGDGLLFVGDRREANPRDGKFDFRKVVGTAPDRKAQRTLVTWDKGLSAGVIEDQLTDPEQPERRGPTVYTLRQRAGVFGHNAPDWRPLPDSMKANYLGIADAENVVDEERIEWPGFVIHAPQYPPAYEEPKVVPTPKAVAAAARRKAAAVVQDLQGEASVKAQAAAQEAAAVLAEVAGALQAKVEGQVNEAVGRVSTEVTLVNEVVTGVKANVAALATDITAIKSALETLLQSLGQGMLGGGGGGPGGGLTSGVQEWVNERGKEAKQALDAGADRAREAGVPIPRGR